VTDHDLPRRTAAPKPGRGRVLPRLRRPSAPRWTKGRASGATLTAVLLVGVLAATVGAGYGVSQPFLDDGSTYLARNYTVVHVNGETGRTDAMVARSLATGKQRIEPVPMPDGRVAIVNHDAGTVEFVDAATLEPKGKPMKRPGSETRLAILPTASGSYLVDTATNTVEQIAAPGGTAPPAVRLPARIRAAVPAGDSVWVLAFDGNTHRVTQGRLEQTPALGEIAVGLTVADEHPIAVTATGAAWTVDGGSPRRIGDTGVHTAQPVLGSWKGAGRHMIAVDEKSRRVVAIDPRTRDKIEVNLKIPTGQEPKLGSPVVLGTRVYVPDRAGRPPGLWQVDLTTREAASKPLEVPAKPGDDFELKVDGGRVWANSQYAPSALVVDGKGDSTEVDKGTDPNLTEPPDGGVTPPPSPPRGGQTPPAPSGGDESGRTVTVPDIDRGTPYEDACDEIRRARLRCDPLAAGDERGLDTGDVIGTNPRGGATVRENSSVVVRYVSPLRVPEVVGVAHNEACTRIENVGLECRPTVDAALAATPEELNAVATQDPPAGDEIDKGGTVTVTYHNTIPLPSLTGMSQGEACALVRAHKMVCQPVAGVPAPAGQQAGVVYEQSPVAGATAQAGATITVTFYTGDGPVGNYVGMTYQDACAQIAAARFGCDPQVGVTAAGSGQQPGIVYAQNPLANSRQDIDRPVTVIYYSPNNDLPSVLKMDFNQACAEITRREFRCNMVPTPYPTLNLVEAQDPQPGNHPIGTVVNVYYSPWQAVPFWIYQHNEHNVWVLRREGDIPDGYGGRGRFPLGLAYPPDGIPGQRRINGYFCTSGPANCYGLPLNHFASAIGSYNAAGWNGPGPIAEFLRCEVGGRPVWRTWTDGSPRIYGITMDAGAAAGFGDRQEVIGCVW